MEYPTLIYQFQILPNSSTITYDTISTITWIRVYMRVTGSDTVLRSPGFRHKHASGLSSRYHRHSAILRMEENHLPLRLPRR